MSNEIFIKEKRFALNHQEQIGSNTKTATPYQFCQELQKLLKPIYDLTMKGRPFVWGNEQQDSFEEIKCRLIKPPVLHMPNTAGRFHLYSDTRKNCNWKCTVSNTEWQIQTDSLCQ